MSYSINEALEAYEARQKKKDEDRKKVDSALKAYESRMQNEFLSTMDDPQSKLDDLRSRIDTEFDAFNKVSNPSWGGGEDTLKKYMDSTRQNRLNLDNLYNEVESWRPALGDEETENILSNLYEIQENYKMLDEIAEVRSQYNSEDEYKNKIKEAEEAQKDYEALLNYDLAAGEKEISELRAELEPEGSGIAKWWDKISGKILPNHEHSDIRKQIEEKETYLARAKRAQDAVNIPQEVLTAEDLDEFVQKGIQDGKGSHFAIYENTGENAAAFSDVMNDYVIAYREDPHLIWENTNTNMQTYESKAAMFSIHMTDEEYKIYAYLYGKYGKERAREYLSGIEETVNARIAGDIYDGEGGLATQYSIAFVAGLDQFRSGMENLFSSEDYIAASPVQMAGAQVREDLADTGAELPDWMGGTSLGQVGYDLINTTSNMLPSILASSVSNVIAPGSGAFVGAGLMGASASGNAYAEMLNLGYSKSQARLYSSLVGVAEGGLQYALGGISSLGGKWSSTAIIGLADKVDNAIARVAIKLGGNAASEFTEEYLQEVLNPIFKNIALSTDEEVKLFSSEALYSGILGALSAGILEGGSTISSDIHTTNLGKNVQKMDGAVERLRKLGTTFSADTVAYQIADKVTEETGAYKIGLLLQEVGGTLSEQNVSDITIELSKVMDEPSAKQLAKTYQAFLNGEMSLTDEQVKVLEGCDPLADVLRKNIIGRNTSIYQRTREYSDLVNLAMGMESKTDAPSAPEVDTEVTPQTSAPYSKEYIDNVAKTFEEMGIPTEQAQILAREQVSASTQDQVSPMGENAVESITEANAETSENTSLVKNIASIENGKVTYNLEDGTTTTKAESSNDVEALVFESVVDMGASVGTANSILAKVRADESNIGMQKLRERFQGIKELYFYGKYGLSMSEITKHGFADTLTEAEKEWAYNLGKEDRAEQTAKKEAASKSKRKPTERQGKNEVLNKDGLYYEKSIKKYSLNPMQKVSVDVAKQIHRILGVNVHLYASYVNSEGNRVFKDTNGVTRESAPNGMYINGDIYLDINAGQNGEGVMLNTLSHELTHHIEEWSPEKYEKLSDFLMEQYAKKGVSVSDLVYEQIAKAKRNGRDVSFEEAHSEVIANSMETMLHDGKVLQKLAQTDIELFNKIKAFIDKIVEKIKTLYADVDAESREGKIVASMKDSFTEIQDLFTDALSNAGENYKGVSRRSAKASSSVESVTIEAQTTESSAIKDEAVSTTEGSVTSEVVAQVEDVALGEGEKAEKTKQPKKNFFEMTPEEQEEWWEKESKNPMPAKTFKEEIAEAFREAEEQAEFDKKFPLAVDSEGNIHPKFSERTLPESEGEDDSLSQFRYSERDSNGGKLSKGQQEYFKDSKVRDDKGNLLVVYHGTRNANFTVFKRNVNFFTDSAEMAESYSPNGEKLTGYLNIVNPLVIDAENAKWSAIPIDADTKKLLDKYGASTFKEGGKWRTTPADIASAIQEGIDEGEFDYDGIIIRNVDDTGSHWKEKDNNIANDYIVFNSNQFKNTTNTTPSENPDIRYSFRDSESGRANDGLSAYNDELTKFIKARGDYIVDSFAKLEKIVNLAFDEPNTKATAYFGIVNAETLKKIKDSIPNMPKASKNILFKKGRDYSIATTFDSIRHIADEKGLTREDILDYLDRLADTIIEFESVTFDFYTDSYKNRVPGLLFKKTFADGTLISFDLISQNKRSLVLQSLYLDSVDYKKKKSAKTLLMQNSLSHTPEVRAGQTSTDSIYQKTETVKEKLSERDPDYAEQLEKLNKTLEKENAKLKEDKQNLKELLALQKKVTNGKRFTQTSVIAAAKKLMKYAGAKGDAVELARILNTYYEGIVNSENLDWEDVTKAAKPAVEWLKYHVSIKPEVDETAMEIRKFLKKQRAKLTEEQKSEAAYSFDSYNNFRKKAMRYMTIAEDATNTLEGLWQDLSGNYPEYFDSDVKPAEMPKVLMETMDSLRDGAFAREVRYEYEESEAMITQDFVREVYNSYWDVSTLRTVADTAQKEINLLKAKHGRQMNEAREHLKETVEKLKQDKKDRVEKVRKQYQDIVKSHEDKLIAKHKEQRERARENRAKTEMRHKIKKVVGDLNHLLIHGNKERNVKIGLQPAVAAALEAINFDTVAAEQRLNGYTDENGKYHKGINQKIAEATDEDVKSALEKTRDFIQNQGDAMNERLEALRKAYSNIQNQKGDFPDYYRDEAKLIQDRIELVIERVGKTPLRFMSLEQLTAVYNLYTMVLTTVKNANKVFKQGKTESLQASASSVMFEIQSIKKLKEERSAIGDKLRGYAWNELSPFYAFNRIGSKTLSNFFWEVIKGQDVYARDIAEANAFQEEVRKKHGYSKWKTEDIHEFKLEDGRIFSVSLKQMFSIYAYSKRKQALEHMSKGGFFFNDKSTFRKKGKLLEQIKSNEEGYCINENILKKIKSAMTEEQIEYVDEMQAYLTDMGKKGNEVTRVIWGIDIFNEAVYFPLRSVKDFIYQSNQPAQESSLKNDGMTKETKPGASNPIVLESFDDVWASHVERMSQYHGFVIPIDNLNKILNYGTWAQGSSVSVSTMLTARYGNAVNEYLTQFIRDLNGSVASQGASNPIIGMLGKFKKTAVAASASVVIQQPTAVLRAASEIDAKYFVGLPKAQKLSTQWETLKRYAPVAIIKEIGGFDAGSGRQATEWLNANTYKGIDKVRRKVDDISMWGAAQADVIGWLAIWEAVKRECVTKYTNLAPNSEEFLKKAGERFTEVIVKTQVYDSTLSRSGYMRSKSDTVKMATAFMGEPTTSINMLFDAVTQAKRGTISKGTAIRKIGAVYASIIAASAAASLIYAMRDDDDDESFEEKYFEAFGNKIKSDINPLSMLPFAKDIISIFDGWEVERVDMAIIQDIYNAWDALDSDTKSPYRKVEDLAGAIAALFGLPVKNVMRTGREIYSFVEDLFDGIEGGDIGAAFARGITGEKKDKGKALYDAILNGDKARLEIYRKGYKDDKAYETAVRQALRENDPRIKEAAEARIGGDIAEYTRIVKQIKAEGFFSQDTIVASINAEINALNKGESSSSNPSSPPLYKMDDYYASIVGGDQASAYVVKEDIINAEVANGKDRDEAEGSFNSRFANLIREEYENGYISEYDVKEMLVNYGGKSEEDATSKVQYWTFKQEYPNYDDLSEEAVEKYYDEVEPYGIGIDVYYDYSKQKSKCKGTDANGDGKTDSGSVKAEVLQVINSLPLTYSQKDALYYLNGWSAKTIYEAPWH